MSEAAQPESNVRLLGQAAALLAIAATTFSGISILANVVFFSTWGLNFASVASATDIVVGGIAVFGKSLASIFIILTAIFATLVIRDQKPKKRKIFLIIDLALMFLVLGLIIVIQAVPYNYIEDLDFKRFLVPFASFLFSAGIVLHSVSDHSALWPDEKELRGLTAIWRATKGMLLALLFLAVCHYVAERGQGNLIVSGSTECGDLNERVVWLGATSVVTTCDLPPFADDLTYFIKPRSDFQYQSTDPEY